MDENNGYQSEIITLTDEDGSEIDFEIIGQHELNGVHYVALLPANEEETEDEDGNVEWEYFIFKFEKDEDGEDMLVTVDDDDEFDDVADYFDDLFSQQIDYDN